MREKDFNTGLRGVLFEAKHYARMGPAIWLYGWLVLRQTHQCHGVGYVLGGAPITYREIESETGFNRRTLEAWMRVLRREGYVQTHNVPAGISVQILKAKKHRPNRANTSHLELSSPEAARQTDLFRRSSAEPSFAQPAIRDLAGLPRESADPGPRFCVASAAKFIESAEVAAPMCSSSVEGIKDNHFDVIHSRDQKPNDQSSFGWDTTPNRKVKSQEGSFLEETNPRNRSDGHTSHPLRIDESFHLEMRAQAAAHSHTPSPRKVQAQLETHQPHEQFPWELRKRMRLIRAEREEQVRRELYVGTGPEGRR